MFVFSGEKKKKNKKTLHLNWDTSIKKLFQQGWTLKCPHYYFSRVPSLRYKLRFSLSQGFYGWLKLMLPSKAHRCNILPMIYMCYGHLWQLGTTGRLLAGSTQDSTACHGGGWVHKPPWRDFEFSVPSLMFNFFLCPSIFDIYFGKIWENYGNEKYDQGLIRAHWYFVPQFILQLLLMVFHILFVCLTCRKKKKEHRPVFLLRQILDHTFCTCNFT